MPLLPRRSLAMSLPPPPGVPAPARDVLRTATLDDVLRDKHRRAPDRRRVLLLEHNMTVADALEARRASARADARSDCSAMRLSRR